MSSVGIEFPRELLRCQELLVVYRDMGPEGAFGTIMLMAVIERAKAAWESQDPVEIVKAFAAMKECA